MSKTNYTEKEKEILKEIAISIKNDLMHKVNQEIEKGNLREKTEDFIASITIILLALVSTMLKRISFYTDVNELKLKAQFIDLLMDY